MDVNMANSVGGYLETLYDVNVKLIKLCGMDIMSSYEKDERLVLDIIQDIFRLFPYRFDKRNKILKLDNNGGLLEFSDTFNFLENDFSDILKIFLVQIFSGNKEIDYTVTYLDESYKALGYKLKNYIIERKEF
jgi:hypothetical protein